MVSSSYFTGNLVGTLIAGKLIQRIGFTRSYHLACVVFAVATAGMALSLDFWSWMGWRFFARHRLRLDLGDRRKRLAAER
jgi:MFS transporter, UMF2 family, putative MFS family transporter protein